MRVNVNPDQIVVAPPPNQIAPPPPPAHQTAPPRFPEEVHLPEFTRRHRRYPRWHIPVMGDPPHGPFHQIDPLEPIPLDILGNPLYHGNHTAAPWHHAHPPIQRHMGHHGPALIDQIMGDPREPIIDPTGVPVGRENIAYGGMINYFPRQRSMGGLEVTFIILHDFFQRVLFADEPFGLHKMNTLNESPICTVLLSIRPYYCHTRPQPN